MNNGRIDQTPTRVQWHYDRLLTLVHTPYHSTRGGNESDADRIVLLPLPFSYLQNKYECEYGCYQIRMRLGCFLDSEQIRIIAAYCLSVLVNSYVT